MLYYYTDMKLVLALGNDDPRYAHTRHNVGFFLLDHYAAQHKLSWQEKPKFKAHLATTMIHNEKVILAKPTTYYNLVGESLQALAHFYAIEASDIVVLHDDLALPLGTIRTRIGGSGGGSNGIKSINAHGGEATNRIRIGIATPLRTQMADDAAFVLGTLTTHETATLTDTYPKVKSVLDSFMAGDFEATTHPASE